MNDIRIEQLISHYGGLCPDAPDWALRQLAEETEQLERELTAANEQLRAKSDFRDQQPLALKLAKQERDQLRAELEQVAAVLKAAHKTGRGTLAEQVADLTDTAKAQMNRAEKAEKLLTQYQLQDAADLFEQRDSLVAQVKELKETNERLLMGNRAIHALMSGMEQQLADAATANAQLREELERNTVGIDSYGEPNSNFRICSYCHAESGAGMLDKGIPHEQDCILHESKRFVHPDTERLSELQADKERLLQLLSRVSNELLYRPILGLKKYRTSMKLRGEINAALEAAKEQQP